MSTWNRTWKPPRNNKKLRLGLWAITKIGRWAGLRHVQRIDFGRKS